MPVALEWLIWAFATSFAVCAGLIVTQKWHGRLTLDHDTLGVQKLHRLPVPRVGGAGVLLGLGVAVLAGWLADHPHADTAASLLLCALPAFGAGLLEDLTKRISVRQRLVSAFASAALAAWLLDCMLTRLNVPGLDDLMVYPLVAAAFTVFAVGGVTNAINIIDGLNGLASGSVAIMLAGIGAIAWLHGDTQVLQLCLTGAAALVGFLVFNYPFGRIFLGDGGAYLAGFWLAECAVLLLARNPSVSTWAPLLACLYPVWETVFSMFRRSVIRRTATGAPDTLHLHHLLLRRLVAEQGRGGLAWVQHGVSSTAIWLGVLACQVAGISFSESTAVLAGALLLFVCCYLWVYATIARTPSTGATLAQPAMLDASLSRERI